MTPKEREEEKRKEGRERMKERKEGRKKKNEQKEVKKRLKNQHLSPCEGNIKWVSRMKTSLLEC